MVHISVKFHYLFGAKLTSHLHSFETYLRSDIFCVVPSVSTSSLAGFDSLFSIQEARQSMIALKLELKQYEQQYKFQFIY